MERPGTNRESRSPEEEVALLNTPLSAVCEVVESNLLSRIHRMAIQFYRNSYPQMELRLEKPCLALMRIDNAELSIETRLEKAERKWTLAIQIAGRRSNGNEFEETAGSDVGSFGMIERVCFRRDITTVPIEGKQEILESITRVIRLSYSRLATSIEGRLMRLTTASTVKLRSALRQILPGSLAGNVWAYALICGYGMSLSDEHSRKQALETIAARRSDMAYSPLEAAIALIAVQMERANSFSQSTVVKGELLTQVEVEIGAAAYSRLIKDSEIDLYGTGSLYAIRIAHKDEIDIVAAYPQNIGVDVCPLLRQNAKTFQRILDEYYGDLLFLANEVNQFSNNPKKAAIGKNIPNIMRARHIYKIPWR